MTRQQALMDLAGLHEAGNEFEEWGKASLERQF